MATSGRMQGNSLTIGGQGSQYYFIDWSMSGQISWQPLFYFVERILPLYQR